MNTSNTNSLTTATKLFGLVDEITNHPNFTTSILKNNSIKKQIEQSINTLEKHLDNIRKCLDPTT